jgi:hypothetical protein
MSNTTIGLDIAKSVFQVHALGAKGNVVLRKALKRGHRGSHEPRLIGAGTGHAALPSLRTVRQPPRLRSHAVGAPLFALSTTG